MTDTSAVGLTEVTVRRLLFDSGQDEAVTTITRSMVASTGDADSAGADKAGADSADRTAGAAPPLAPLRGVSGEAVATTRREIAELLAGLLEIPVLDSLIQGWSRLDEVWAAAARTRDQPGSTEVVDLVRHTIGYEQQPRVDVVVDGLRVAAVDATVTLDVTLSGAVLTLGEGKLREVRLGAAETTATLLLEQQPVARSHRHFDTPGVIRTNRALPGTPRPSQGTTAGGPEPG